MWGHRFESMMLYRRDHNNFHINFSAFHSTYEVDTPTCNARTLEELYSKVCMAPIYQLFCVSSIGLNFVSLCQNSSSHSGSLCTPLILPRSFTCPGYDISYGPRGHHGRRTPRTWPEGAQAQTSSHQHHVRSYEANSSLLLSD